MYNEGTNRTRRARRRKGILPVIKSIIKTAAGAILDILFIVSIGGFVGIGFGWGMALFYIWIS